VPLSQSATDVRGAADYPVPLDAPGNPSPQSGAPHSSEGGVVANWARLISELCSKALACGVVIPVQPIDGEWHRCDLASDNRGTHAYDPQ
jgi:hypothetical protein